MYVAKIKVWLYWVIHHSNAFEIPLSVTSIRNPDLFTVTMPQIKESTKKNQGETFLSLTLEDVKRLGLLAISGREGDEFHYQMFTVQMLITDLEQNPDRIIVLTWDNTLNRPKLYNTNKMGLSNLNPIRYYQEPICTRSNIIRMMSVDIKVGDGTFTNGIADFNISRIHSIFPKWAYDILLRSLMEKRNSASSDSIVCGQIDNLNLPTFTFSSDNKMAFTLSNTNYFMRNTDDGRCYLVVQPNSKQRFWVIGAAFLKTQNVVLRKASLFHPETFHYGISSSA